jgi:hypothetical protein
VPFGYHGYYLRIDVSGGGDAGHPARGRVKQQLVPLADAVLRQFLGGSGLKRRWCLRLAHWSAVR